MSRYCTIEVNFQDGQALLAALMETGSWTNEQIEVHEVPQHLFGYKGDLREQKAHIIVRRKIVGQYANDIGFVKDENGQYQAIISEFDTRKYGSRWLGQLKGNYAFHKIRKEQESRGRRVARTRCDDTGRQRIEVTGYR